MRISFVVIAFILLAGLMFGLYKIQMSPQPTSTEENKIIPILNNELGDNLIPNPSVNELPETKSYSFDECSSLGGKVINTEGDISDPESSDYCGNGWHVVGSVYGNKCACECCVKD